jgi:hypothetical protein
MNRTDWKGSPTASFRQQFRPANQAIICHTGCSQGSLVHRDWVGTWNGTGNGPMASLVFEPLYSAHPVGMMGCDDWELGEKICAHTAWT